MKLSIEPTTQIVEVNQGRKARIWEGRTESGVAVYLLVTLVAVHKDDDAGELEAVLAEQKPPSPNARQAFPLALFID